MILEFMNFPIYQIDAFTSRQFEGNPAAVIVIDQDLPDHLLQFIAKETGQPATAFLRKIDKAWLIRWFTLTRELPLCGHGTLAGAWVIFTEIEPDRAELVVHTKLSGDLHVARHGDGFSIELPAEPTYPIEITDALRTSFGCTPVEVRANAANYLGIFENAQAVMDFVPDLSAIAAFDRSGMIITAVGVDGFDCVSRYFAPAKGVPEDPVTGSAHCAIVPYWSERLGRSSVRARQASSRGGVLECKMRGDRVELIGQCVLFSKGSISLQMQ
jgi:PhzF family phenazine biosynthesis protein